MDGFFYVYQGIKPGTTYEIRSYVNDALGQSLYTAVNITTAPSMFCRCQLTTISISTICHLTAAIERPRSRDHYIHHNRHLTTAISQPPPHDCQPTTATSLSTTATPRPPPHYRGPPPHDHHLTTTTSPPHGHHLAAAPHDRHLTTATSRLSPRPTSRPAPHTATAAISQPPPHDCQLALPSCNRYCVTTPHDASSDWLTTI